MTPTSVETLRRLYVEHRQQFYTYAVAITRNREAAEDAIQSAFHNLLRVKHLPEDLRPYAFRCIRNACLDGLRRSNTRHDSIFVSADELRTAPGPSPNGIDLEAWFAELSTDEREAVTLKTYDGFTFQEIAELRDVPLQTAASWYRRGLEKLKRFLTAETQ